MAKTKNNPLDDLIRNLPPGLDRCVLRIMQQHVGRDNVISRGKLVGFVRGYGFYKDVSYRHAERMTRACINQLRKKGYVICSIGGDEGGYWIAQDWDELIEFIDGQLHSRAMDLLETEKALRQAGEQTWGRYSPEKQLKLI